METSPKPARALPLILFIVSSDPRTSARPAEAIRVAAGLGAWKKAEVRVYLHGPAIRALGEWVDELKDEDNYTRYLPMLVDGSRPALVEAGAVEAADLGEATAAYEEVDATGLAGWCGRATTVLRF